MLIYCLASTRKLFRLSGFLLAAHRQHIEVKNMKNTDKYAEYGPLAVEFLRWRSLRSLQVTGAALCIIGLLAWLAPGPWKKIQALGQAAAQSQSETVHVIGQGTFVIEE